MGDGFEAVLRLLLKPEPNPPALRTPDTGLEVLLAILEHVRRITFSFLEINVGQSEYIRVI